MQKILPDQIVVSWGKSNATSCGKVFRMLANLPRERMTEKTCVK